MPLNSEQQAELEKLLASNRKIEAIKKFREFEGVGLKEAKEAVEALESGRAPVDAPAGRRSGAALPEAQRGKGCLLILAAGLALPLTLGTLLRCFI
ncbi:ribosomal protein L7/L12 [Candidatus Sumerlaeota bacterium]|nr:ribosomal protein L7/L12 [Candidatus Sumerlaeota bacterium]